MENKVDKALKKSFNEEFKDKKLNADFYKDLNLKLEKEIKETKTIRGKINRFLNKEIEIEVRVIVAAAILIITFPSIFSLKEVNEEVKMKLQANKNIEIIQNR